MAAIRGVDTGMLVRSAAGKKLGEVERTEEAYFLVRRGGLFESPFEYAVRYDDVLYRRAGAVVIPAGALHPLSELLAQTDPGTPRRTKRTEEPSPAPADDDSVLPL